MFDTKKVLEQVKLIIQKANKYGVAAEKAVDAFYAVLFPPEVAMSAGPGPMNELPVDFQNEILDAAEAVQQ